MSSPVHRATLFALYQLTIAVGIFAMPLAIAARRVGLSVPIHRLISSVGEAYEDASTATA